LIDAKRRWNQHSSDFGKPVWQVLEGQFEMLLANAELSKKSPARERRQLRHLDSRSAGRELIRWSFVPLDRSRNCATTLTLKQLVREA
jgi:hypothetical protein